MKIKDLKERIEISTASEKIHEDGDREIVWEKGEWAWAKVAMKGFSAFATTATEKNLTGKYEVIMRKNYISHTRHALKTRIRWNRKLLEMISPWQETEDSKYVYGMAIEKAGAEI